MKSFPHLRTLVLSGIAAACIAPALAQSSSSDSDRYYYFGAGAGKSRIGLDGARIANAQLGANGPATFLSEDDKDNAYKVFLGYQFNRLVGMELGYFHLGQFNLQARNAGGGTLDGKFLMQGVNLDVVGTLPITDNFAALGRIGGQYARTRDTFGGSVPIANRTPSERELNLKLGVGLQYAFSPAIMVRAEVERFRINDAVGNKPTVNFYSASLVMPFGRSAAPAPRSAMAAPAYVEPRQVPMAVAAPQAVVAVAPPAPLPSKVSYEAESMFSFDKATLRPEGMQALDGFVQQLRGAQYATINVQGYADRLGSDAYNQKLSLERAEAVKTYLVDSGKLDAGRIKAAGMGESSPVTAPGECVGNVETAALVRCLRPDRRVEITVAGTR